MTTITYETLLLFGIEIEYWYLIFGMVCIMFGCLGAMYSLGWLRGTAPYQNHVLRSSQKMKNIKRLASHLKRGFFSVHSFTSCMSRTPQDMGGEVNG